MIHKLKNLMYKDWLDYTIQLCLSVYYCKYILNIYHNDLCYNGNIRNIMIKNNNTPFNIKVEDFKYKINNNYTVKIDLGQQWIKEV